MGTGSHDINNVKPKTNIDLKGSRRIRLAKMSIPNILVADIKNIVNQKQLKNVQQTVDKDKNLSMNEIYDNNLSNQNSKESKELDKTESNIREQFQNTDQQNQIQEKQQEFRDTFMEEYELV